MLLYHGTKASVARKALTEGLRPRSETGLPSHWEENKAPSNPDAIYLTVAYAGYFAHAADEDGEGWGIVEVDTDRLDASLFVPDEDFLEQATRNQEVPSDDPFWRDLAEATSMEERTAWYRENITLFAHLWGNSLEGLGNCAYQGSIPPEAITRVTVYDPKSNPTMTLAALDPLIIIINFRICGAKYKEITRWLAGYEGNPNVMSPICLPVGIEIDNAPASFQPYLATLRRQTEEFAKILADRDGITILEPDDGR